MENIDKDLITPEVEDFNNIAMECVNLYARKNHDYGNSFDKGMDTIGTAYGIGRIYDKVNRLITLSNHQAKISDESFNDTLIDLACYSIMMIAYNKRNVGKIAIIGHPKKGKEVIEELKKLGGFDTDECSGTADNCVYYIDENKNINCINMQKLDNKFKIYTLEEYQKNQITSK